MLRRFVERRSASRLRSCSAGRLSRSRNHFFTRRICLPVPNSNGYETRRDEDWQTWKAHDEDRSFQRSLRGSRSHCDSVSLLRGDLLRSVDADVERGNVLEIGSVQDSVSDRRTSSRRRIETQFHHLHDQVFDGVDSGDHFELLGLEQQDSRQLDKISKQDSWKAKRRLRVRIFSRIFSFFFLNFFYSRTITFDSSFDVDESPFLKWRHTFGTGSICPITSIGGHKNNLGTRNRCWRCFFEKHSGQSFLQS